MTTRGALRPAKQVVQRGGFVIGLVVGLLIGLALALGVALYVTKVPVPFINKVPQRTAEQDAAETEKNRNWDPNSALYGKNPAKPASVPAATPADPATATATPSPGTTDPASAAAAARAARAAGSSPGGTAVSTRDPAAILADRPGALTTARADPAASAGGVSTTTAADAFRYFVQVGAYGATDEAEQQRARLAMLGFVARITEREQAGRVVYRVRLGPFDRKEEADSAKERLDGAGLEAALVRVQR